MSGTWSFRETIWSPAIPEEQDDQESGKQQGLVILHSQNGHNQQPLEGLRHMNYSVKVAGSVPALHAVWQPAASLCCSPPHQATRFTPLGCQKSRFCELVFIEKNNREKKIVIFIHFYPLIVKTPTQPTETPNHHFTFLPKNPLGGCGWTGGSQGTRQGLLLLGQGSTMAGGTVTWWQSGMVAQWHGGTVAWPHCGYNPAGTCWGAARLPSGACWSLDNHHSDCGCQLEAGGSWL